MTGGHYYILRLARAIIALYVSLSKRPFTDLSINITPGSQQASSSSLVILSLTGNISFDRHIANKRIA